MTLFKSNETVYFEHRPYYYYSDSIDPDYSIIYRSFSSSEEARRERHKHSYYLTSSDGKAYYKVPKGRVSPSTPPVSNQEAKSYLSKGESL